MAGPTAQANGTPAPQRRPSGGKNTYFGQYITADAVENLQKYVYHGADNSIIYKHILSPLAGKLVEYMPRWIAPNMITLIGVGFVVSAHIIFLNYCPDLHGEAPTWAYLWSAFALLAYQTLDNMDGKQARRTGTSSPLGLLFDHGCDAINITISALTQCSILQMGQGWKSYAFVACTNLTFYMCTWEEYYTGSLQLPIINGPTEGLILGATMQALTGLLGPSIWLQEFFGYQLNTWFIMVTWAAAVPTLIVNVYNVWKALQSNKEDSLLVALTRLTPYFLLNGLFAAWLAISPKGVVYAHPRLVVWTTGLLNAKLTLHLMLAHLTDQEYHPFRKTLVPIFFVAGHVACAAYLGKSKGGLDEELEELVLLEFFAISVLTYLHIIFSVVREISVALNIPVLTVPREKWKAS